MSSLEDVRFERRLRKMVKVLRERQKWLLEFAPERKAENDEVASAIEIVLHRAEEASRRLGVTVASC